jgi:two-component sensor histidine kinase
MSVGFAAGVIEARADLNESAAEILIAEANHRIANNLMVIASLTRLQASSLGQLDRPIEANEARQVLREAGTRIETVSMLHRLLAEVGRGRMLELTGYVKKISMAVVASMSVGERLELRHTSTEACLIRPEQAMPIGLIVCELVTNAIKHAHPAGAWGTIAVDCQRLADGRLRLEISDDGVGLPQGLDPNRDGDIGFRVLRSLAQQLNAGLAFVSNDFGLSVELLVPCEHKGELD